MKNLHHRNLKVNFLKVFLLLLTLLKVFPEQLNGTQIQISFFFSRYLKKDV